MKPLVNRDPYRIGLVAIAAGVAVAALIGLFSVVSFGTHTYTAELEHTAGLRAGEDVQVGGVSVGEVKEVELLAETVQVTFVVDDAIELGSGTTAAVKVATLLGTHYLSIDPQGPGSLEGNAIPLANTSVPYNLQDVLEEGTETLGKLDPVLLARSLSEMSNTLAATNDDLAPALTGIGRLSEVITRRSDQVGELLTVATSVTDQLQRDSGDIVELMKQTNLVVGEITSRREAIHDLLVETTRLADSLTAIVDATRADVKPALRDLNLALDTLRREDETLKNLLEVMAPATRYIANLAGNGPWADLYLKPPALPADDATCRLRGC